MKKIPLFVLIVSIFANVVLAIALSRKTAGDGSRAGSPSGSAAQPTSTSEGVAAVNHGTAASAKVTPGVWTGLASNDLKQLTANLTAAGFPCEAIRAAINGVLDERYRPRLDALYAQMYGRQFWHREAVLSSPELNKELRAIANERLKITLELLGTNIPNEEGRRNRQARYGQIPDEKLDAIEAIVNDYQDLGETSVITFGAPMPWDRERRALIEAETRKDVAALLTPEELAAYDLRASRTASSLRFRTEYFKPTMAEFTAILPLQQAFDAKHAEYSVNESPERTADKKLLDEQIKTALGEARYAEYQRAQDNDYRTASRVVERLNLPAENAQSVYALKQEYQNRASAVRSDKNQTPEQRTAALQELAREARGRIDALLTPSGAKAYTPNAFWLHQLQR